MIQTIRVAMRETHDPFGERTRVQALSLFGTRSPERIRTARVYRLEGVSEHAAREIASRLLTDPVTEVFTLNQPIALVDNARQLEVAYKPGVMNPEAASVVRTVREMGYSDLRAADSSTEYHFLTEDPDVIAEIAARLLVNKTTQRVVEQEPETLLVTGTPGPITIVPIRELSGEELMALSKDKLFLNQAEMEVIQGYFRILKRDPTDAELETIAQTWSEHCGHKTFNAKIILDGVEKTPLIVRLRNASLNFSSPTSENFVISCFVDNSGVVEFYDGQAICGKVETHNSPSAIEPYGGAATGSGGVFRDIMGTGQGAKVILSTDMFCLAPFTLSPEDVPPGCLHPRYLLSNVIAGVGDYGNRMGIPTANGSFHFHSDFRAKPSVIVGAYGIIPIAAAKKGVPQPGDRIIAIGGRTGRDGIHGATFSSAEMTERTVSVNSLAVQIGHAIEEKRTSDALLACRNEGLVRANTDCGAGGFSSAIGEIGKDTGVWVGLEQAPLKYSGLAPWEIWISESQERMVLAVAPEHVAEVLAICAAHNVEAVVLGEFTDDHQLTVTYEGESVCRLDMAFLHNGLPQRVMRATRKRHEVVEVHVGELANEAEWIKAYSGVMAHPNVCSRESVVRLYDHGVQGTNALPPYGGVQHDAPNDAVVLQPIPGKPYGMVVSHGLNPVLNRLDPYWGTLWALTEAAANYVAVGGDLDEARFIDNFIWPFPDEESLGDLDTSVDACVDFVQAFNSGFVSGKDSLSSTFRFKDGTVLKIPPVLCASVFGRIPDVTKTVSADFKASGNHIVLVGRSIEASFMGGSAYDDVRGAATQGIPRFDVKEMAHRFRQLHGAIRDGLVLSCHDVSEGGMAVTLAEMAFGGNVGARVDLAKISPGVLGRHRADHLFFNETPGCFLVEVSDANLRAFLDRFHHWMLAAEPIGVITSERHIAVTRGKSEFFQVGLDVLKKAWKAPMKEVFR